MKSSPNCEFLLLSQGAFSRNILLLYYIRRTLSCWFQFTGFTEAIRNKSIVSLPPKCNLRQKIAPPRYHEAVAVVSSRTRWFTRYLSCEISFFKAAFSAWSSSLPAPVPSFFSARSWSRTASNLWHRRQERERLFCKLRGRRRVGLAKEEFIELKGATLRDLRSFPTYWGLTTEKRPVQMMKKTVSTYCLSQGHWCVPEGLPLTFLSNPSSFLLQ